MIEAVTCYCHIFCKSFEDFFFHLDANQEIDRTNRLCWKAVDMGSARAWPCRGCKIDKQSWDECPPIGSLSVLCKSSLTVNLIRLMIIG